MFEESLIYQFIKNSGVPFIVRHNRHIYKTEPQFLDPVNLFRRVVVAAVAGYFIGRKIRRLEVSFTLGFACLPLLFQLATDLSLRK